MQFRDSQREEMPRQNEGGERGPHPAWHRHVIPRPDALGAPRVLVFVGGLITQAWSRKSLAVGDNSASSPCRLPRGQGLGVAVPVMWLAPCNRVLPAVTKGLSKSRLLNVNALKGLVVHDESLLSPLFLRNPGQKTLDYGASGGRHHSRHAGNHGVRGAWCHTCAVDADKNTSLIIYYHPRRYRRPFVGK